MANRLSFIGLDPNLSGILFGQIALLLATWLLIQREKATTCKITLAAIGMAASIALVAATRSRGALLALGIGIALAPGSLFWLRALRQHAATLATSLLVATAVLIAFGGFERMRWDGSLANRAAIAAMLPRMLVESPWGTGPEGTGWLYTQFYQATSIAQNYRTLVASHFDSLLATSWPLRFVYVSAWTSTAWLLIRIGGEARIALAWWLHSLAACFCCLVWEHVWLAIAPLSVVVAIILHARRESLRLARQIIGQAAVGGALVSVGICLLLFAIGSAQSRATALPLTIAEDHFAIGEGTTQVVIFGHPERVFGQNFGVHARKWLESSGKGFRLVVMRKGAIPRLDEMRPGILVIAGSHGRLSHTFSDLLPLGSQNETSARLRCDGWRVHIFNPTFAMESLEGVGTRGKAIVHWGVNGMAFRQRNGWGRFLAKGEVATCLHQVADCFPYWFEALGFGQDV